ncbi:gliding motility-associated C-terminal domain-containing protein [Pontibacter sp. 172403-2]|uniref:LamG-like jellyroll fold domain-containing protein n=1 Tax=Pontibacter rufus TaxID=2791028 RepID=UPI0018AF8411|nr:LamG-like jellyroll fold domain-containing protein [Pontibacter sp. 172403-2]MBF9253782.1 gliding motility-associated C-terminal domain-containing protein [Pontibacter sp. 172403-2]
MHAYAQGPRYALKLDGYDDYVELSTSDRGVSQNITVEAWIKTSSTKYHWVLGKYDRYNESGYHLIIKYGKAAFAGRDGSGNYRNSGYSTTNVNDNNWHHLAGICNNGIWQIYVDGVLQNQLATGYTNTDLKSNAMMAIGKDYLADNENYNGQVEEIKVWKRALSAEEIRQGMCQFAKPTSTDLVVYLKFDEGAGSVVKDHSSIGISGTFRNMNPATAWTTSGAPIGDKSTYIYTNNWQGKKVELDGSNSVFAASGLNNTTQGFHIYHTSSAPNAVAGISDPSQVKEYYGIFKVGDEGNEYKLALTQKEASCTSTLYNRLDNASLPWIPIADTAQAAVLKYTASQNYGEFAATSQGIGAVVITGPATLCTGSQATLSIPAADGQIVWSNGATGKSIPITTGGRYSVSVTAGGCTSAGFIDVAEAAPAVVNLGEDKVVCAGEVLTLTVPAGMAAYKWSTGATSPTISATAAGTYWVEVTNTAGCVSRDEMTLTVRPEPDINLPAQVAVCYGQPVEIGTAVAGAAYKWSSGQTTATIRVGTPGIYEVVYTLNGCSYSKAVEVIADECPEIPNIITPNGDGKNDTFVVLGVEPGTLSIEIMNRWGKPVYQHGHYDNNWSAAGMAAGVYYYQLTSSRTDKVYKGWLEVLR